MRLPILHGYLGKIPRHGSKSRPRRMSFRQMVQVSALVGLLVAVALTITPWVAAGVRLARRQKWGRYDVVQPIGSNVTVLMRRRKWDKLRKEQEAYQDFLLTDTEEMRPVPDATRHEYEGREMSPRWFERWQELRAKGVDMGDRLLVPMHIWFCIYTCSQSARDRMQRYLLTLDTRWRYYLILGMDKGLAMWWMDGFPRDLDLLIFQSGGTTRHARNIQMPLLRDVPQPKGLKKDITVGAVMDIGTHETRTQVRKVWDTWKNPEGFRWETGMAEDSYIDFTERSNFTLAPRGHGSSSFRMYQALSLGSIPIYIWAHEYNLPYSELVNWNDIAIVIQERRLSGLLKMIREFDVPKSQRLMHELRHMWTYEFAMDYILRRLQTEALAPVPIAAYADIPGREADTCEPAPKCPPKPKCELPKQSGNCVQVAGKQVKKKGL